MPYVPRGDVDVLTTMSELLGESNYQAYFQHQGAAEDALEADPERFLRRFVYAISGDNPDPTDLSFPQGADFVGSLPDPADLPAWFTAEDLAFYTGEFTRTGFRGALNWYRASLANHELLAPFHGAPLTERRPNQPVPSALRKADEAAGGIIADTSPPNVAISLTSEEAT